MRHLQSFLSLCSSKLQQCYLPDHVSISTSVIFGNAGAGGRVRQRVGGGWWQVQCSLKEVFGIFFLEMSPNCLDDIFGSPF